MSTHVGVPFLHKIKAVTRTTKLSPPGYTYIIHILHNMKKVSTKPCTIYTQGVSVLRVRATLILWVNILQQEKCKCVVTLCNPWDPEMRYNR
jgi:hypothetical protein